MVISSLRIHALATATYPDIPYTGAFAILWSFAEPAIGISVACAPLCKPLFRRWGLFGPFSTVSSSKVKSTDGTNFQRLHDQSYPLANVVPNVTTISRANYDTGSEEEILGVYKTDHRPAMAPNTGIMVKKEWTMERL